MQVLLVFNKCSHWDIPSRTCYCDHASSGQPWAMAEKSAIHTQMSDVLLSYKPVCNWQLSQLICPFCTVFIFNIMKVFWNSPFPPGKLQITSADSKIGLANILLLIVNPWLVFTLIINLCLLLNPFKFPLDGRDFIEQRILHANKDTSATEKQPSEHITV